MSRFISEKTKKVDLGDDEWIEIKENIAFEELLPIISKIDKDNELANIKIAMPLLEAAIVGWNLKDDKGNAVPFEKGKIKTLDVETVTSLVQECTTTYFPQKKNSDSSGE